VRRSNEHLTRAIGPCSSDAHEVPISYHGRTYAEGKKIGWRDGVNALKVITKYGLVERFTKPKG